jgi:argininosuccinate synthase
VTNRVVLAYSGDLKTSVAVQWLTQHHRAEVVAVTLDLGQQNDLEEVRDRALAAGAVRAHVLDVREEFARHYLLPALRAGALCLDRYPLASALARPLIAKTLVDIARIENATAIAHGSAIDASDGPAIETLVQSLDRDIPVIAPARKWTMTSEEMVECARRRGIPGVSTAQARLHMNLWGRTLPVTDAPTKNQYVLTRSVSSAPETAACVMLGFEQGVPVTINGVPMPLTELIESLTLIAGQHGVGRLEWQTHRQDGSVQHEISEAPAAHVLHAAYESVHGSVFPQDLIRAREDLSLTYAALIRSGRWFSPLREALDAFHAAVQSKVTGVSHVHLLKGKSRVDTAPEIVSYA